MLFLIRLPFSLRFLLSSVVLRLLGWDAGRIKSLQVSVYDSVFLSYVIPVFSLSFTRGCFKKGLIGGIYCNFNVTITN